MRTQKRQRDRSTVEEKGRNRLPGVGVIWLIDGVRQGRIKAPEGHAVAYYHCISRVVDRRHVFEELEREQFVALMREYETFCGVRIITYCVLSNHFHVLVEVPRRPEVLPTDEQLLQRIEGLSGLAGNSSSRQLLEQWRAQGHHEAAELLRERCFARMWDVSGFMKLLKQRFSQWFNRGRGRKGTLWEERFKSVLVESHGPTLAAMAAYIDLNPVRANLVTDPKDYRWCGYAEAMAGQTRAQEGLRVVVGNRAGEEMEMQDVLAQYRVWLFGQGEENEGLDEEGRPLRLGISRERVLEVMAAQGRVRCSEYLRLRVRYFTEGAVLGTRGFVNEVFGALRSRFGPRRKDGARRVKGWAGPELFTLRDLRLRVVQ